MRRRVWVVPPLVYVMAAVMLVMALLSYKQNKILFAAEVTVSFLFAVAVVSMGIHFRRHVALAMRSAEKVLGAETEEELNRLPLSVAVVGFEGDLIWANSAFVEKVGMGEKVSGENIMHFIYPRTLRQIVGESGTAIAHGNKEFTVYSAKTENSYVLYFVDDTYFKQVHKEYLEKRPVVSVISFDNREELTRDASGGDESRITAEVEAVLRNWATKTMGGFIRKLSGGRYMMISDEIHIENAKQKRFEILDMVREVKGLNNMSATVSIGIGRGAPTSVESETWARQALDMALGRGGDQVAIMKKGDTYEFFGGLSKGIEKRDKVRTRVIAATLSDHIKKSDKVYIMGHRNSDLDSVGASVGMWAATTRGLEKTAFIVVDKNQTMAEPIITAVENSEPDKRIFVSPQEALQEMTEKSLLIIVDTHSYSFVESTELLNNSKRVVVIDHHRMMITHIKNSIIFYHEPYASSASEMIAELVQYIENSSINSIEAEAMLAGITLDTKNFVLKTGVRTFEASAYLRRRGADTVRVKKLFANSFAAYKERAGLVSSAEIYKGCAIACNDDPDDNTRVAAAQAADELLSIQGVNASFVLFKFGGGVNISARSLGDVNVQLLLEAFGGGGHLTMAGAQLEDCTVEEAKDALIAMLDERLEYSTNNNGEKERKK